MGMPVIDRVPATMTERSDPASRLAVEASEPLRRRTAASPRKVFGQYSWARSALAEAEEYLVFVGRPWRALLEIAAREPQLAGR